MKTDLKNLTLEELTSFFDKLGEKKFRASQVFSWLYKGVLSFEEMTNISKELREKLGENAEINNMKLIQVQSSVKDGTRKYLFEITGGDSIETVFMKYRHGNTICISSQAGCRMGCTFCASGINGLQRNLSASEMVEQILAVERDTAEKISNIVIMGTGEPFDNYENLIKFIKIVNDKEGLNIGARSITVSTCGLIPKMFDFAEDFPQVNLAISLHAPNDEIRNKIMPINKKYNMEELISACKTYVNKTGRRITFEYALVKGLNDSEKNAEELAYKLKGMNCHVNLIPLNRVMETGLDGSLPIESKRFYEVLQKKGIQVTIRRELGSDIDAACGQLRLKNKS